MRKVRIYLVIILLFLSIIQFEHLIYAESSSSVVVNAETLNVRSGPGLTYPVTKTLSKGEEVTVIDSSGDWYQIKDGWIAKWLTSSSQPTPTEIVSKVDSLNIRAYPSTQSAVLGKLNAGERALSTSKDGNWVAIAKDGVEGWVYEDYVSVVEAQKATEKASTSTSPSTQKFTVAVDGLNVRKQPDLSSKRVGLIYKNESYPIVAMSGNWVEIQFNKKKTGWVSTFHGTLSADSSKASANLRFVTTTTNGTNIREKPSTSSNVVQRVNAGEKFAIVSEQNDWYEVQLANGQTAFIASWVVSDHDSTATDSLKKKNARVPGTLQGLTIVVDPGHGGNDRGTSSVRGISEKSLTLQTAELLVRKLQAAGANVLLTRESDTYVALRKRVSIAQHANADVFISLHYDANPDASIRGFTTYYTKSSEHQLALAINNGLASTVQLRNRGVQPENFHVLRENQIDAVLIELGFLSNPSEERVITTDYFREQATHGIYQGLLQYFNAQLPSN